MSDIIRRNRSVLQPHEMDSISDAQRDTYRPPIYIYNDMLKSGLLNPAPNRNYGFEAPTSPPPPDPDATRIRRRRRVI